ncbi:hypothetical protein SAY86_031219 [Trapa natans]|uniref:RNase H type-1 domain-containing protein n=1 Tax=Trapa natans TaxID=22666 RepID=A0AAN7M6B0_TRANT|nr:hypothetical protein SAY86_031219 [Trapa natans]
MSCLSNAPSYAASILRRSIQIFARNLAYGSSVSAWSVNGNTAFPNASLRVANSNSLFPSYRIQCYSSKPKKSKEITPPVPQTPAPVADAAHREKDALFVVRKGDAVGVYRCFKECQAQVGSSIRDLPVSIYKGHLLSKDTEDYLISRGLKNALYVISAADMTDDIFGPLTPCIIQEPATEGAVDKPEETLQEKAISRLSVPELLKMNADEIRDITTEATSADSPTCILEFDGSSKGNPGKAGAGAVLRSADGNLICRLREGAGTVTTNNIAEYRAIILGLKYALIRGYRNIQVKGDSKLVCMQVEGRWKVKNKGIFEMWEQVNKLKERFHSFEISHVLRALNSEADAQANIAVNLADGEVEEECVQVAKLYIV